METDGFKAAHVKKSCNGGSDSCRLMSPLVPALQMVSQSALSTVSQLSPWRDQPLWQRKNGEGAAFLKRNAVQCTLLYRGELL